MSTVKQIQSRFSAERLAEIKTLVGRYPTSQAALLPVLHLAQEDFGYLSEGTQRMVAELLDIPFMAVREVVTFYTMFHEKPDGTYLLEVCTNASCMLNGAYNLVDHLCKKLNIRVGETTADGMFTIAEVECAGACGGAPVVQINNAYHENVNKAHLDGFIDQAKAGEGS
ncbi:MAG: NADH-quinone oxidoreductase subunit NuoE [Mariprofundaceae bacterium]